MTESIPLWAWVAFNLFVLAMLALDPGRVSPPGA
jgi:hypothetical protein